MKKIIALSLLIGVFLFSGSQLFAEDSGLLSKFGLVFEMRSLALPVSPYSDGVSSGAGLKFWLTSNMALRGLFFFNMENNSNTDTSTNTFGVAAAFEYHFISGKVSPYVGALGGFTSVTNVDTVNSFYLGGLAGVEYKFVETISVFAEYGLYFIFSDPLMTIDLGRDYGPAVGLIFYFG